MKKNNDGSRYFTKEQNTAPLYDSHDIRLLPSDCLAVLAVGSVLVPNNRASTYPMPTCLLLLVESLYKGDCPWCRSACNIDSHIASLERSA